MRPGVCTFHTPDNIHQLLITFSTPFQIIHGPLIKLSAFSYAVRSVLGGKDRSR